MSSPIQNALKQGDSLSSSLLKFALGNVMRKVQDNQKGDGIERYGGFWSMLIMMSYWAEKKTMKKNI
jgi:hypothetical protein